MGDGAGFSAGAALDIDGRLPLFTRLYGGGGSVGGWTQFADLATPDDATGTLRWFNDPEAFDKAKVKLWLFTNAHITHGKRVVRLLGVGGSDTYLYELIQLLIHNPRGLLRRHDLL